MREITHLVVHGTMTNPKDPFQLDVLAAEHYKRGVRSPYADSRTAYHWIILRNGDLVIGRETHEPARLSGPLNDVALAVLLVGGLDDEGEPAPNYSAEQWHTLYLLCSLIAEDWPDLEVIGHRDVYSKPKGRDCPGFDAATYVSVSNAFGAEVKNEKEKPNFEYCSPPSPPRKDHTH